MLEQLSYIIPGISIEHLNILLLLGLALVGGTIGGRLFQILRIPQVVGYIIIGFIVGRAGLNFLSHDMIEMMQPFNYFALGLIGFMIGGEFKKEILKRYGKQFATILTSEALITFLFVFLLVGFLGSLFLGGGTHFWILGLLLGSIASATAPAATTDVLWEYKAKGPLTTTVLGIVALDDGFALMLFAIVANIVSKILGTTNVTLLNALVHPIYEIGGAIVIGVVSGLTVSKVLMKYNEKDKLLAFSLGAVLFVLGVSLTLKVSMLLAAMTLGVVVVNRIPRISEEAFNIVDGFSSPIYVLFFVLVGAKLSFEHVTIPLILITSIYLIARTMGKMLGSNIGARLSGAPTSVRKYMPFCLFSQAGVAIGLSIVAYHSFPSEIGDFIVIVITFSTFVVQLIGAPAIKYAITKSGEVGLNITEEDLVRTTRLKEVMDKNPPLIHENTPLSNILGIFSKNIYLYYPVIGRDDRLVGIITVESIRQTFMHTDLGEFLLAHDIMEPVRVRVSEDSSLIEVREILDRYNLDYLPVVTKEDKIRGFIERRMLNKFISTKMIELEHKVSSLTAA